MKASKPPVPAPVKPAKKRISKKWIIIIVSVVVVLAIIGTIVAICSPDTVMMTFNIFNWDEYRQLAADRKTVAVCNGYEIPYEELRFVTLFYKNYLADIHGEKIWDDPATAETYREELEKLVIENLNQNYIVLSACKQLGISTSGSTIDNYVDTQISALKSEFESKKAYKKFLAEQGMTEHYLRFSFSIGFLESAIHYTMLDNDMYEYRYEDNHLDFIDHVMESGEYVRTLHVFIENVEGEDPAVNLAQAQEVSDKLQAAPAGEERRNLLSEYIGSALNDDLLSVTGDGHYFMRGEMVEAYENAAFELEIGEVSEPVVCSGGNFVIMRLEPEEEYVSKNVRDIMDAYYGVCLNEYIENFRPGCEVYYTEYGKTLDILEID